MSDCLRSCPKDKIEEINEETEENVCWPCLSCPPGQKPSVSCGSIVNMGAFIQCEECEKNTFSVSYDMSLCRKCTQCELNEIVSRPCRPSADTVCARCKPDQNTWIDTRKEEYGCFKCPVCLSGFEPSHPCGSVVPYGEIITCVPCQEGKTFSTMRDKRQCRKCSSCPRGQNIIARCTKYSDTICGVPCGNDKIVLLELSRYPPNVSCIDCPLCREGMEPSVDCGGTATYGREVFCVSCKPGLTYSDRYGSHKCKRCTTCSPGKVLISHCSINHDTICGTSCLFNQITFFNKSNSVCVDCIKCSVGMEPSISCGAVVEDLPWQGCKPCKVDTFSSTYGTEPCQPCSNCGDKSVTKRCTKTSNTVCSPCKHNYYYDPFVFTCLPCSSCCSSWSNNYPRECNLRKWRKCQARRCSSTLKAPSATALVESTEYITYRTFSTQSTRTKNKSLLILIVSIGFVMLITIPFTMALLKRYLTLRRSNPSIQIRSRKLKGKLIVLKY